MADIKIHKIEMWPIDRLIPYENNVKKHELAQVSKIAAAIQRHGWDQPIVVDKNGIIIKGHGRRLAGMELGLKNVPVIVRSDLSDEQVKAARLSDNRVAMSDYDPEMLRLELASMEEDMSGIFDDKELEFLDADLGSMDSDAFVTDMDSVVAEQKADLDSRADAAACATVPIAKAFGLKTVPVSAQLAINRLMAKVTAGGLAAGVEGGDALALWIDTNVAA